jgi:hypothetical protein
MGSVILCVILAFLGMTYFLQVAITIYLTFENEIETKKQFFYWLIPIYPAIKALIDKIKELE